MNLSSKTIKHFSVVSLKPDLVELKKNEVDENLLNQAKKVKSKKSDLININHS